MKAEEVFGEFHVDRDRLKHLDAFAISYTIIKEDEEGASVKVRISLGRSANKFSLGFLFGSLFGAGVSCGMETAFKSIRDREKTNT